MDAMKVFTEELLKKDAPQFNVGDTVRVSVRIKEGERERFRLLRALSSQRNTAASLKPSRFAALLTALALSVCSRFTLRL